MMTIADDDKWKLDTNFLQPISCDLFGGAHMDGAVFSSIEKVLLQRDKTPSAIKQFLADMHKSKEYYKAKVSLEILRYSHTVVQDIVQPLEEDDDNEIRIEDGELVVGRSVGIQTISTTCNDLMFDPIVPYSNERLTNKSSVPEAKAA